MVSSGGRARVELWLDRILNAENAAHLTGEAGRSVALSGWDSSNTLGCVTRRNRLKSMLLASVATALGSSR